MAESKLGTAEPTNPGPRKGLPRWLKYTLLGVGGTVVGLLGVILAVGFLVDLGPLVHKQVTAQLPAIEQKLGRSVRIGRTKLKLLPKVRLEVLDVAIEAAPGQSGISAQPLLKLAAVRARVAVLPALLSLGRRLRIDLLEVDDLKVQVVRTADGKLSYEDILDKLDDNKEESKPLTPEEIERLAGISVDRVALSGGGISFYDLSTAYGAAAPLKVDQIDFVAERAQLFAAFPITLDMAILSSSQNFHLGLQVGPLPKDLKVTAPLSVLPRLELKLRPVQLEPLLRFMPQPPGLGLEKTLLSADLLLEAPGGTGDVKLTASASARGTVLKDHAALGKQAGSQLGAATDLGIATQLTANVVAGNVKVEKLELSVSDMGVTGHADLRTLWSSPSVNSLALSSRGLLLERLVALLPPSALPPSTTLRGPLTLRGAASGTPTQAKVEVALDLTAATLLMPALSKPAGTALVFELLGQLQGQAFDLQRLGLTLGPLSLVASGIVRSGSDFDLKVDTGSVDLDRLLRLLPTVDQAMATVKKKNKARIDGDLRIAGTVKKKADQLDGTAKITMRDANLAQGDITLRGNAALDASVRLSSSTAGVNAKLDLTGAELIVPGSVDKDNGVPMRLQLQAERTGKSVNVKLAELELPGGTIKLVGSADLSGNRLDMKVPVCELELDKLAKVVPALSKGSMAGFLDSKLSLGVSLDGNPNKLSTVRASLDRFVLRVAGGTIKGKAQVIGLDEPRSASFDFDADYLDLDKLLGLKSGSSDEAEEDKPARSSGAQQVPKFLRKLELDGKIKVAAGKLKGNQMKDFVLEVGMSSGKLVLKVLRMMALGGNIVASGSTVDVSGSRPKFNLRAKLDKIELADVLALKSSDLPRKLTGRGSLDLSADGSGLAWEDIAPKLTGSLGMGLLDAKLQTGGLGAAVLAPMLARANSQLATVAQAQELTMTNLAAQFRIENGKLQTTSPISMNTPEGQLRLSGAIGLDKSLGLTGELQLTPEAVAKATGGKLQPDRNIPVGLRIVGTLTKPQIEMADPVKTVAALTAALLRGRGADLLKNLGGGAAGDKLSGKLGGALGNVLGGAAGNGAAATPASPTPATPSPQEAQRQLEEAARKRLQDQAKKGLGGLFGR